MRTAGTGDQGLGKRVRLSGKRHPAEVICEVLEAIDNRCLAMDGRVSPTLRVATDEELRRVYVAVDEIRRRLREGVSC